MPNKIDEYKEKINYDVWDDVVQFSDGRYMKMQEDVYPVREDVPAELWEKPIVKRKSKMSNPQFDSLWNPWNTSYKNVTVNVNYTMKAKNYVHTQESESTRSQYGNNKPKKVLRNTRRK